jgi:hypothetical protein
MVASFFFRFFFVVNNGDLPTCDQMQQLRCRNFFPHIVLFVLIEKFKTREEKIIIAHNTLFGTSSMKNHVEYEHFELVTAYVEQLVIVNNILGSQVVGDEGCKTIQPAKKCSKVALGAIFTFFGSKTPYNKQDEA